MNMQTPSPGWFFYFPKKRRAQKAKPGLSGKEASGSLPKRMRECGLVALATGARLEHGSRNQVAGVPYGGSLVHFA